VGHKGEALTLPSVGHHTPREFPFALLDENSYVLFDSEPDLRIPEISVSNPVMDRRATASWNRQHGEKLPASAP
jgi:hypothetical protein